MVRNLNTKHALRSMWKMAIAFLAAIGFCGLLRLMLFTFATAASAAIPNVKTYIPPQAFQYFPMVKSEQAKHFKELGDSPYIPALIEHESCISLTHKRCWNPSSELNTSRERGVGFGQITKAYKKDGTLRFDALGDLRKAHLEALQELSWDNVPKRPDLQIRAVMLMSRDNYMKLYGVKSMEQRIEFMDAAYNGGLGGVNNERRACSLRKGCDPQKWFNHVEDVCLKSKEPIYSGRSACDINRYHVSDVVNTREPKYHEYFKYSFKGI